MACHAGIAPFKNQSGTSVRGRTRVSPLANKQLKSLLFMAAIGVATLGQTELAAYYKRKVAKGKPKMSVINAVANKILARAYACLRDDRLYEKRAAQDEVKEESTPKVVLGVDEDQQATKEVKVVANKPTPQKVAAKATKPTFTKTQNTPNKSALKAANP